jgi:hypothetical protein
MSNMFPRNCAHFAVRRAEEHAAVFQIDEDGFEDNCRATKRQMPGLNESTPCISFLSQPV